MEKDNGVEDEDVTRPTSGAPSAPAGNSAAGTSPPAQEPSIVPARPAYLRHLAPEERGEIKLTADEYLLGRSHSCAIPLHSPTASRRHARIFAHNGEWLLGPLDGKAAIVDGRPVFDEISLRHGMKIQLGGDELVFLLEELAKGEEEEETLVIPSRQQPPSDSRAELTPRRAVPIVVAGVFALLAGLVFWLLL